MVSTAVPMASGGLATVAGILATIAGLVAVALRFVTVIPVIGEILSEIAAATSGIVSVVSADRLATCFLSIDDKRELSATSISPCGRR